MEIGWKQGQAVKTLFESTGFCDVSIYPDEAGRDRVVAGRKVKEADKLPGQEYGKPASASADDELCTVDAETDASEADVSARTTQHWRIYDAGDPRITDAGRMIREGRLVAFPTETVYGLGANGLDEKAVAGIYEAKSRPADNPLILHVASVEDAKALTTEWGDKAARLADKLWPGPLTIVLPAAAHIPDIVTAGLDTIAIRYPSDPIALALIEAAGVPVAAPSANASGRPSPTRAEHVLEDMAGRIDVVLDNGPCKVGLESTILDLSVELPAVLRPGDITIEALRRIIGEVRAGEDQGANTDYRDGERGIAPKAPGMKYRHYAPRAPVAVLQGEYQAVARYVEESLLMQTVTSKDGAVRQKTGLLLSEETWLILAGKGIQPEDQEAYYCRDMGSHDRPREMGTLLYEALRACDREGTDRIYVEACSPEGQGAAVLNRLRKAAGSIFIQVM
jgi:L-threonylcarbamoyladenylate synthase